MTSENQTAEIKTQPDFTPEKNIWKKFSWGMNLQQFSGGEKRLTKYNYRAYSGYLTGLSLLASALFIFLVIFYALAAMGLNSFMEGRVLPPLDYMIFFILLPFFAFNLVVFINVIRADIYRFHDFGLSGWLYAFLAGLFFVAGVLSTFSMFNDIAINKGFLALLALLGSFFWFFLYHLQSRDKGDKYGKAVSFRWKSFSLPVRFLGQLMFVFVILSLAVDLVIFGGSLLVLILRL